MICSGENSSDAESDPVVSRARRRRGYHQASGSSSHASSLENTPTKARVSKLGKSSLMASKGRLKLKSDLIELRTKNSNKANRLSFGASSNNSSAARKLSKHKVNKAKLRQSLPASVNKSKGASSAGAVGPQIFHQQNRRSSPTLPPVQRCVVAGCDSRGHLSGRLPWHSTPAACPLFHNVTAEQCVALADQRVTAMLSNSSTQDSTSVSKRLRLSAAGPSPERNHHVGVKRLKQFRKQSTASFPPAAVVSDLGAATTGGVSTSNAFLPPPPSTTNTRSKDSVPSAGCPLAIRQPSLDGLGVLPCDRELFLQSQAAAVEDISFEQALSRALMPPPTEAAKGIEKQEKESKKDSALSSSCGNSNYRLKWIVIGGIRIAPWYQSPYPDEYVALDTLFVCEFCFRYYRTEAIYRRHLAKCVWRHPPGDEIYRKDDHSIFEVDGNAAKHYCQNLCLFAKLFIANKTLFYEVETFLFYVLTKNDPNGCHATGYFSKEKHSLMNCNLSCLLVFPSQSRRGYGKFLIDFSYLLSRLEGRIGSPERPLSDLGLLTYRSYWKEIIVTYLGIRMEAKFVSIKEISDETGIHRNDIVSTLQVMGILKYWKGRNIILKRPELTREFNRLQQQGRKTAQQAQLAMNWRVDALFLRWTPRNRKPSYTMP